MPETNIGEWAKERSIPMDPLYSTPHREGGTPALDGGVPGYTREDLSVFSAAGVGVFLYVGFEWVTPLAEETTDYRLIGRGMLLAIGLLAFWLEEVSPVFWIVQKAIFILGGLFLPIDFFPPGLAAVARDATAADLVQPGHVFPLQAQDGGVLMRAGHTEAGCDLAGMAGLTPAAVICEVMKDDGTMARLPDLELFAREHGLKIGTIADLIGYRSRNESLIERIGARPLHTPQGRFDCLVFKDKGGGLHLALKHGQWTAADEVPVRVHEPFTALDLLDAGGAGHSWPLQAALAAIHGMPFGVTVLLNTTGDAAALLPKLLGADHDAAPPRAQMDLRTYGIGAQILRELGVARMKLLGSPRRMPSMTGYGLEITGFLAAPAAAPTAA